MPNRDIRYLGFVVNCDTPSGSNPSRVPNEIWEHIIDFMREEPRTLLACIYVCKAWYARSIQHLTGDSTLSNHNAVLRFARLAQQVNRRRKSAKIYGSEASDGKMKHLSHIALFAAMLAGQNSSGMRELTLGRGVWRAGAIPRSVFLHLSAFSSITKLILRDVTFPSILIVGRLVCSLTSLKFLLLWNLFFSDERRSVPVGSLRAIPPNLRGIKIHWDEKPVYSDVYHVLAATRIIQFCHRLLDHSPGHSDIPLRCIQDRGLQHALECAGNSLKYAQFAFRNSLIETELDVVNTRQLVDQCLNLSRNTSLQKLEIYTSLRLQTIQSSHLLWLPRLLSHVPTSSIREITIVLEEWDWEHAQYRITWRDVIQDAVGLGQICSSIDDLLSAPHYTRLKSVKLIFSLPYRPDLPGGPAELEEYTARVCPKLYARGILKTYVGWLQELQGAPLTHTA
ncbi:hypothetical protein WOLCODRAFT_107878, partial [Wolfiporia cocos MD-104 SS10]